MCKKNHKPQESHCEQPSDSMKNRGLDVIGQRGITPCPGVHTHVLPRKTLQDSLCFPLHQKSHVIPISDLCLDFSKTDSIAETEQRSR